MLWSQGRSGRRHHGLRVSRQTGQRNTKFPSSSRCAASKASTNPHGFILVDKHQHNPAFPEIFAVRVCVAVLPVGKTPVPVGVPKAGLMIESMITTTARKIGRLVKGMEPDAEYMERGLPRRFRQIRRRLPGAAANSAAQPQLVVLWQMVHTAKAGFETYFLHKIRSEKSEPFYARLALQVLDMDKLKEIKVEADVGVPGA